MSYDTSILLDEATRGNLYQLLEDAIETSLREIEAKPVFPNSDVRVIRESLAHFDFSKAIDATQAFKFARDGMEKHHLRVSHPCYFGVFNPHPTVLGILAEALVAALNPQLASWTSAPFAIELEQHTLRKLAGLFGYAEDACEGTFTNGGTEANHTALLAALYRKFPEAIQKGLSSIDGLPTIYVTPETHHSFLKAARLSGLGSDSVREIDLSHLRVRILNDRQEGCIPFLIVGTAGTTSAGEIEPLSEIANVAEENDLWFHADAAWGGAAMVCPSMRPYLEGVSRADSITFDAHKWFNAPMTAGVYLSRRIGVLESTFRPGYTPYMPPSSQKSEKHQPYAESFGWSRRFNGLKVFLALAVSGWEGQEKIVAHQIEMGTLLKRKLIVSDWKILNETPLPVVCFTKPGLETQESVEAFAAKVAASGECWITTTNLRGVPALRAGIANFRTEEKHLDKLIEVLASVTI